MRRPLGIQPLGNHLGLAARLRPALCIGWQQPSGPHKPTGCVELVEAVQRGGPSFKYKGIDFTMQQGVLHWMSKTGRWIPVSARPSGDYAPEKMSHMSN